jgi:CheY-like chemotaxis protein
MTTILVIDDEPLLLKNLEMILEFENFQVVTAIEGKSALEILRIQPVNLILCDMLMVPMNGFEILQAVRQNPKSRQIPFVFVTGVRWNSAEVQAPGVSGYLSKPFTRIGLLDIIQQQLTSQHAS